MYTITLVAVQKFSRLLKTEVESCTTSKSKVKGRNKEATQTAFFQFLATGGQALTEVTGNHQLTVWLAMNVFDDSQKKTAVPASASSTPVVLSPAEQDIAHYIGGFVCCKLKQGKKDDVYREVVETLITTTVPGEATLLFAKSRGSLLNLTKDGQSIFVALEQVFRSLFPLSSTKLNGQKFLKECVADQVVQDCFHSSTFAVENNMQDDVLCDMILLYFKVRVRQQCKNVVEQVRRKNHDSKKEKALRSRLAK